ncbi:hypothetical protein CDAR_168561 [Caerostris darwini]|uniref:Uncharacterized protein n=1 Tax=Caerostris darwini TaxID=1538125 RepID=A0AAV4T5L8_9ARAC|nr:hypothetical protein CDAR_168561 [Caerostris darwini]
MPPGGEVLWPEMLQLKAATRTRHTFSALWMIEAINTFGEGGLRGRVGILGMFRSLSPPVFLREVLLHSQENCASFFWNTCLAGSTERLFLLKDLMSKKWGLICSVGCSYL